MHSEAHSSTVLFANTGVQYICLSLPAGVPFTAGQVGQGWQHCKCKVNDETKGIDHVQWQLLSGLNKLFLAVDTTIGGDDDVGYFARVSSLGGDVRQSLHGLLGADGKPLEGLAEIEFTIRPATAEGGEPKDVHMVVDFGNSRTGALLLEFRGETMQEPLMTPLQLVHRYHLNSWDEHGELVRDESHWWFSSKTHWCTPPYNSPPKVERIEYEEVSGGGWFGGKPKTRPVSRHQVPDTFQDISMVRMGREADDLAIVMRTDGDVRTGVSSPKRYLWAKDASWLEGAIWIMADPFSQHGQGDYSTSLKGPMLKFLPEEDLPDEPTPDSEEAPAKPCHAPRVLMTAALYEILCQAYTYINSPTYRRATGDAKRMRQLRTLTLTYPSGMIAAERERLGKQAQKAVGIFAKTLGRKQRFDPELKLSVDEASAVHLTYIWSEVQKLGRRPSLWFSLMGRGTGAKPATEEPAPEEEAAEAKTADEDAGRPGRRPRRAAGRRRSRAGRRGGDATPASPETELRIACIDIGGGTSDLMIAKYVCQLGIGGDRILGETLHRDGISVAGDLLVKRLLETVIVPVFAEAVGLENQDVQRLFGPEVPGWNREFRAQRINWINRLLVPLAQAYLENAVDEVDEDISHTDPEIVASEVLEQLQETVNQIWGPGVYNVNQELGLGYDKDEFEDIVHEVFDELIFDYCESIVQHEADVVLLAGQPSKLRYIQELVRSYLPLPRSRIIPMYGRYVGPWYPYQNPDDMNPGVIVDPKSTVVVGAAVEFSARHGMLTQFQFKMSDEAAKKSYFWGMMTDSHIHGEHLLFHGRLEGEEAAKIERREFTINDQRLIVGRKRRAHEYAEATPVYVIKVDVGDRIGEIDVKMAVERKGGDDGEEVLQVVSAEGSVAGQPAVLGKNVHFEWRTLADERFYLDTGGLDAIELT